MEEVDNPVEKVFIDEEEFDGIEEMDDILNLVNLPRTTFVDKEFWNLKVLIRAGQLTTNINKKKPYGLQA